MLSASGVNYDGAEHKGVYFFCGIHRIFPQSTVWELGSDDPCHPHIAGSGGSRLVLIHGSHDHTSGKAPCKLNMCKSGVPNFYPAPASSSSCLSRARTRPAWAASAPMPLELVLPVHIPFSFSMCSSSHCLCFVSILKYYPVQLTHIQEGDWKGC